MDRRDSISNQMPPDGDHSDDGLSSIGSIDELEARELPPVVPRQRTMSASFVSSKTVKMGVARRTLGLILMVVTISMWTASNFLASSIFADDSYSKPYFVTWLNVGFFSIFLLRPLLRRLWRKICLKVPFLPNPAPEDSRPAVSYSALGPSSQINYVKADDEDDDNDAHGATEGAARTPTEGMFLDESMVRSAYGMPTANPARLTTRETIKLALPFSVVWFLSNLLISACLEYTTVASSTVLGATSSAWTLAFGALFGAERFSVRKLVGVAVCLLGVLLISQVDLSGESDENRGSFPEKSSFEMALGDTLALLSAMFYALYTILLKKRVGDESRLDVFQFFGFIGLFDLLLMWPGIIVLHFTGQERFEIPPTPTIWWIIVINGVISVVSDICWTFSMLLTSPLVIAVGVSLAIPMSLFGQMIINGQSSSIIYWIGSMIVVASFLLINRESKKEAEEADQAAERANESAILPANEQAPA